jgi:hypothetical protein
MRGFREVDELSEAARWQEALQKLLYVSVGDVANVARRKGRGNKQPIIYRLCTNL